MRRHTALQPLSREHHHGLALCRKIRQGFEQEVAHERIKQYADWFWLNHLVVHFEVEEKYVFPILGNEHKAVKRALAEHRRLKRLFNETKEVAKSLILIEEELADHIRFEERVLFNEIQSFASPEQLQLVEGCHHEELYVDDWQDKFWKCAG